MLPFAQAVDKFQSFLLCTHLPPDGDGLGSQMALHTYLLSRGKNSYVINPAETPEKFRLVDPQRQIKAFDPNETLPKVDAVVIVDTNETKMLGPMEAQVLAKGCPIYFIDHHLRELPDVSCHLIDESAGSSGELVYQFIKSQKGNITYDMAVALYVAVASDTGGFRFKRTKPSTHHLAAELLQIGVHPEEVFQNLYARESIEKLRLLGHCLNRLQAVENGRIVWTSVTQAERKQYGASIEDTEAFINSLTLLAGVQIAIFLREDDKGVVKLSLRGTGSQPVVDIAKHFGGGGHRFAAGARILGPLPEVIQKVLHQAKKALTQSSSE